MKKREELPRAGYLYKQIVSGESVLRGLFTELLLTALRSAPHTLLSVAPRDRHGLGAQRGPCPWAGPAWQAGHPGQSVP